MAFSSKSDPEHLGVHSSITNLSCLSETPGVFQLMQGQSEHLQPNAPCGADLSRCVSPRSWGSWTGLYSLTELEPAQSWPRQRWHPGAASWFLVYLCLHMVPGFSLLCALFFFLLLICFSLSSTFSQLYLRLLAIASLLPLGPPAAWRIFHRR